MNKNTYLHLSLLIIALLVLVWSGINPYDRATWYAEIAFGVVGIIVLIATYKRFQWSNLTYTLITIHCCILFVGGKYTYALTPIGEWLKPYLPRFLDFVMPIGRNNYDKIGHFAQGVVPAIIMREFFIRKKIVSSAAWRNFLIIWTCLGMSAFFEFIEWWSAIIAGSASDSYLGMQGFIWDAQSDMLMAFVGAILALLLLSRLHDKSMAKVEKSEMA